MSPLLGSQDEGLRAGVPRPGEVLGSKYRVRRVLGMGGMGAVLEAENEDLGQPVAIKVMLPELAALPEWTSRFFREARASGAIQSEHVARVYDTGRLEDGSPYMVMELLSGQTLDAVVRDRGPLPVSEAVRYILEACEGLAHAHAIGIIHRDVKPSNLFLSDRLDGSAIVKVLDFGVSKASRFDPAGADAPALTGTNVSLGSPQYMSPEQIRDARTVDVQTDVWALGITLHKLLTGRMAFEAETIGAYLAMIVVDPPTPLRRRRPEAPAELEAVLLRCLEKDRKARYASVADLAKALAPFADERAWPTAARVRLLVGGEPASAPATGTLPPAHGHSAVPGDAPTVGAVTSATSVTSIETRLYRPPSPQPRSSVWTRAAIALAGLAVLAMAAVLGARSFATSHARVAERSPTMPGRAPAPGPTSAATPAAVTPERPAEGDPDHARPDTVSIRLRLEPSDARVEVDGVPSDKNPLVLPRSSDIHVVVVQAPGRTMVARDVSAARDTDLVIALPRAQVASKPGRPSARPAADNKGSQVKTLKGPMEKDL